MDIARAEREVAAIIDAALARGITPEVPFIVLVGLVVSELRSRAGLTQSSLSACAAISQATLSRIENGETPLDAAQVFRLSNCLGVSPEHVFAIASRIARHLEGKHARVSGNTPTRAQKHALPAAEVGAAALAPIIGASLLGPVGLVVGAMVNGWPPVHRDNKRKRK
jgi:transcriptional regulator with XRE-family HTH domain